MSVLVFGSINVDLSFRLTSLPGPGETVIGRHCLVGPGGKGANQAVAAARAGARSVRLCGAVGTDVLAAEALRTLRQDDIDVSLVRSVADAPTGCAAVMVDAAGNNQIIVAPGANLAARSDVIPDRLLQHKTVVLLQMEVPWRESLALAQRAKARGARVCLNLAPAALLPCGDIARSVDLLVINENEAHALASAVSAPAASAASLAKAFGITVVVTLGARGAEYAGLGGGDRVPSLSIDPVDTTGAGDTFVGAFAAALDLGRDLPTALRFAAVAAALSCLREGAQTGMPYRSQIEARISSRG
jgi:ribokinase